MTLSIRPARPDDEAAVAALRTRSWQSAYRGHLPDDYLDTRAADDLAQQWRAKFAGLGPRKHLLLAMADDQIAGFIAIWPDEQDPTLAFIDNLHVDPERRSGGIGRSLMTDAARRLASDGYDAAYLFVLAANEGAVRFYERLGGIVEEREIKTVADTPALTFRMVWRDLCALAART